MNGGLIPANTKKSMLIFGLFNPIDLVIFGIGFGISLILLLVLDLDSLALSIVAILPGAIGGFLVMPVPNYHNIMTIIVEIYVFYTTRQKFIWKGWCFNDEDGSKK